jgi:large exoprotein involved in heme utilization and adhesion
LSFPENVTRADVTFTNESDIDVSLGNGGDISITGQNINVLGDSSLRAGIAQDLGSKNSQAGDLSLNATGAVRMGEASLIENNVNAAAIGNGGQVNITARSLSLSDGGQIQAGIRGSSGTRVGGQGNSGSVNITAQDTVTFNGVNPTTGNVSGIFTDVETGAIGSGGDINITTGSLSMTNGSQLVASTSGRGNAGNVTINARDAISISGTSPDGETNSAIRSVVRENAVGQGGSITIPAGSLLLSNSGRLDASTLGRGNGGNVIVTAPNGISVDGIHSDEGLVSGIYSVVNNDKNAAAQQGGNIRISTGLLSFFNNGELNTSVLGHGDAGEIIINAHEISARTGGINSRLDRNAIGNGGDIRIRTDILSLTDGGSFAATVRGQGNGGNIDITANNRLSLQQQNSYISSGVEQNGMGQAGQVQIRTELLSLQDGSFIDANMEGIRGNAGDIRIEAGSLTINRLGSRIGSFTGGQGDGGNVTINVRDRIYLNNGLINTGVLVARSGEIVFSGVGNGGDIRIAARELQLTNGSRISANTAGQGDAGNIDISARNRISLNNSSVNTSVSSPSGATSDGSTARGDAGNIQIHARSLFLTNGGLITSFTNAQGNAGLISIHANEQILIDSGNSNRFTGITSEVQSDGIGRGGNILLSTDVLSLFGNTLVGAPTSGQGSSGNVNVNVDQLFLRRGGQLDTSTSGQGNAGNINIQVDDRLLISGTGRNGNNSGISSRVEQNGIGRAGNIEINAQNSISLRNGLIFSNVTNENAIGQAGTIHISTGVLSLSDTAQLSSSTSGRGDAGDIVINAHDRMELEGGSAAFSRSGGFYAEPVTTASGRGGDVRISTGFLSLRDSQLDARTFGRGNAGNLIIEARDRVDLDNGAIFSSSGAISSTGQTINASGRGGNVNITTDALSLRNRGLLNAQGTGTGDAGNIILNANQVSLDRGTINAETRANSNGESANITLQQVDRLLMQNGSQISAQAFNRATGGNVTIDAPNGLVVAASGDRGNNDIIASASRGRGGQIDITALSILGLEEQRATPANSTNDIDASSDFGSSGTVTLNRAVSDPSGTTPLSVDPIDATNQIASACPTNAQDVDRLGEFIVSGRGGLPPDPIDLLSDDNMLTEWVTANPEASTAVEVLSPAASPAIVEAQGWIKDEQGEIRLVAAPMASAAATVNLEGCRSGSPP